jgi:hypothetical protein
MTDYPDYCFLLFRSVPLDKCWDITKTDPFHVLSNSLITDHSIIRRNVIRVSESVVE